MRLVNVNKLIRRCEVFMLSIRRTPTDRQCASTSRKHAHKSKQFCSRYRAQKTHSVQRRQRSILSQSHSQYSRFARPYYAAELLSVCVYVVVTNQPNPWCSSTQTRTHFAHTIDTTSKKKIDRRGRKYTHS